jgi:biopolymer transport protein ExbD
MNFRKQNTIEPTPLQLAPLVDILFLLVIFFAVTQHYARHETLLDVSVPAAETGEDRPRATVGEIIVNVTKDGTIIVNAQELSEEELLVKLRNIAEVFKDQAVILRGDVDTRYEEIMRVLDTCQKAGIWNVAFAAQPVEEGKGN